MITTDIREEQEHSRDMVEYHMAFMKPEVLKQLQSAREAAEQDGGDSEQVFAHQVEEMFGRKAAWNQK